MQSALPSPDMAQLLGFFHLSEERENQEEAFFNMKVVPVAAVLEVVIVAVHSSP